MYDLQSRDNNLNVF